MINDPKVERNRSETLRFSALVAGCVGAAVAVWALLWLVLPAFGIGDYAKTGMARAVQGGTPGLRVAGAVVLVLGGFGTAISALFAYDRTKARRISGYIGAVVGVFGAIALVFAIKAANRSDYDAVKAYAANMTVVEGNRPGYEQRVNIAQARTLIAQAGVVGKVGEPTNTGSETCALVTRDGSTWHTWYREVVCLSNTNPTGTPRRASFDGDIPVAGGTLGSNLAAFITQNADQGLSFNEGDEYGYIDENGNAHLVVPVVRKVSWTAPRDMAAGVVVFDADGSHRWLKDVAAGEIPGPVVPMSVAANVRKAVNTTNGFVQYDHPTRNTDALQTTSQAGSIAAADPNAENATEFVLERDGRLFFVTPLTPFGSSTAVTAYLEVAADEVSYLQAPDASLYRLAVLEAGPQTVATRITGLYSNLQWANANSGSDGNVRRIYEVTPVDPGHVVVTVGVGTDIQYKMFVDVATGSGAKVGEVCVENARTNTKIRCDAAEASGVALVESSTTPALTPGQSTTSQTVTDLSQIPTDQLVGELARRFPAGTR